MTKRSESRMPVRLQTGQRIAEVRSRDRVARALQQERVRSSLHAKTAERRRGSALLPVNCNVTAGAHCVPAEDPAHYQRAGDIRPEVVEQRNEAGDDQGAFSRMRTTCLSAEMPSTFAAIAPP